MESRAHCAASCPKLGPVQAAAFEVSAGWGRAGYLKADQSGCRVGQNSPPGLVTQVLTGSGQLPGGSSTQLVYRPCMTGTTLQLFG